MATKHSDAAFDGTRERALERELEDLRRIANEQQRHIDYIEGEADERQREISGLRREAAAAD